MYDNFLDYVKRPNNKEKDYINICIFYKDRVPFDLRLVAVFNELSKNSKYNFYIVYPKDYDKFKEDISKDIINFDYIILQRDYFDFKIANMLLNKSKELNFKIIYEIDDDLIHMDKSNPGYGYYMEIKDKLEHIISNVDIVTVTTTNLKSQLSYLNDNIHVIPNRLIDMWFEHNKNRINSKNSIKIGYMGSIYHSWDLVLIENAIKNVKNYFSKKDIEIIFELIGGTEGKLDFAEQIEVPSKCKEYFHFVKWFKKNVNWDIAIAPLEYSNINNSKSELKYLEYSALEIPGIYSDIGPYSQSIIHKKNGLLVFENSPKEWEQAIIDLIEDNVLRESIISNSFKDIKLNYQIDQSVYDWSELFEDNIADFKCKILKYYPFNNDNEKILLIGHSGKSGGAEILLKNMIQEFRNQDVDVIVLVKNDGGIIESYEKMAPTFIIDTDEKAENYIQEVSKYGFNTVILNTVISGNFIPILKKYNFYIISLVHELPGVISGLRAEKFAKLIANFADLVIFPSNFVLEKYENLFKIKNKSLIQPQGFYNYYDNFNKDESKQKLADKYNIPLDNHIILNVGRGESRKGFDLFFEVSQKLRNDNFTFIWVGSIDDYMSQNYLEKINSEKNIIYAGFISNKDELMNYYDACDVFLLTSREDPFPSVVLEAFNAKKPVVGFKNAGGFQDIVIDDISGYLVNYGSVEELSDKLKLICSNQKLLETLGNNAYNICQEYDFTNYVKILKTFCIKGEVEMIKNNEIFFLKKQILDLKQENKKLNDTINQILSSSSWKVTAPLRNFKRYIKK